MQCRCHFLFFLLVFIALSLWNSSCLVEGDSSASEGSCSADNPGTCQNDLNESDDTEMDADVKDAVDSDCQDGHPKCLEWSEVGECDNNPRYMLKNCRRSCKQCPDQAEELARILEEKLAKIQIWTDDELEVGADMGEEQRLENRVFGVSAEEASARIVAAREDLANQSDKLIEICKNKHKDCTAWAIAGECEKNKSYMASNCAPACLACDMLLIENRCPIDPNAKAAWEPGSLNSLFEHLTSEKISSKYPVNVLSRDPWVVTLDDVVSEEEAQRLIELGGIEGYERSQDVGAKQADGTYGSKISTGRTSSNAWCVGACYEDPHSVNVIDRIEKLTMISEKNCEYLQLLRYEPGQFYEDHHDYILHNKERQQGVRILTVYLYLNDVEAGGGTKFTNLNITVMPKRGRALLWPSVLNDSPDDKDSRTNHQALPVEAGVKYGANGWYHQYNFKDPYESGCSD